MPAIIDIARNLSSRIALGREQSVGLVLTNISQCIQPLVVYYGDAPKLNLELWKANNVLSPIHISKVPKHLALAGGQISTQVISASR